MYKKNVEHLHLLHRPRFLLFGINHTHNSIWINFRFQIYVEYWTLERFTGYLYTHTYTCLIRASLYCSKYFGLIGLNRQLLRSSCVQIHQCQSDCLAGWLPDWLTVVWWLQEGGMAGWRNGGLAEWWGGGVAGWQPYSHKDMSWWP